MDKPLNHWKAGAERTLRFVIMGSTYTGHYEPVKEMADELDAYEKRTGISVGIHVDAASGGFVAPFATPDLEWDFRIPRVHSINASGHKFGLSYVGVGWIIFRGKDWLPQDLIFELHYLGSVEYTFSLNFSRPAAPIVSILDTQGVLGLNLKCLCRLLNTSTSSTLVTKATRGLQKAMLATPDF